jgi:hypothetical protein
MHAIISRTPSLGLGGLGGIHALLHAIIPRTSSLGLGGLSSHVVVAFRVQGLVITSRHLHQCIC